MSRSHEVDYPPLMLAQVMALRAYDHDHGRTWWAQLWTEWANATDEPLLHPLRNSYGPAWLQAFSFDAQPPSASPFENPPARQVPC